MRKLWLTCLLAALPAAAAEDKFLEWMDRIAQRQLSEREGALAKIKTPAEAEARKVGVRTRILALIGGLPDYNGPLNAKITGKIELPRYTIEKVIFESLPQYFVTANLYRPNDTAKHPGVLMPMGHWENGKFAGQRICANLAMKGFVVLAFDPVGQGERQQAYDRRLHASLIGGATEQHFLAGAPSILAGENFARYRIWDAKRALDYMVSRPEVESEKIGCTGCSGGGTLTAYISALDGRIKVAAPSCYINTWRQLFTGPTGDSEQSFPMFLSSGLDLPDYIELFAPKPYLISNTVADFFPIEGARRAYQEALDWYRIYGAEDKIRWSVGPGGHGTPLPIRENIYQWMIRWLKDGKGDFREEPVDMQTDYALQAAESGQVAGRELFEIIRDHMRERIVPLDSDKLRGEIRKLAAAPGGAPKVRVLSDADGVQQLAIETEPGLEIAARLFVPSGSGRRPAVLLVDAAGDLARKFVKGGAVVLHLMPRGTPENIAARPFSGAWLANTRAWVIGRNLPGMRAGDIIRGVDLLASRADVDPAQIRGVARQVEGLWLLMAAAIDSRISRVWVDSTPYSLRAAFDTPIHRNLHDAVIPGFALHWDLADLAKAIAPRQVLWTDPADWMGNVVPNVAQASYRYFEEGDERFLR